MARLKDVPQVLKSVGLIPFSRRVWSEICSDDLFVWASALAYSWLLAIFPFMIFLLTLLPQLPTGLQIRAKREVHALLYIDNAQPRGRPDRLGQYRRESGQPAAPQRGEVHPPRHWPGFGTLGGQRRNVDDAVGPG